MKKVIYTITLSLLIFNCSSDDDNSNATFLKKYDGTVWSYDLSTEDYNRFFNNLNNPIEEFYKFSDDCYIYYNDFGSKITEIMINSNDIFECTIEDVDFSADITFTVSGNSLKIETNAFEDGELSSETFYLTKSSANLDSLTKCVD